ncbi:MAG: hypothetical protein Q8M08_15770 [Bacteroidales bacterium]|nr:hypothetical protein [Bacteroidales bacterium]
MNEQEQNKTSKNWSPIYIAAILIVIVFVIFMAFQDQQIFPSSKDNGSPKTQWQIRDSINEAKMLEAKIRYYNDTSRKSPESEIPHETTYVHTSKPTFTYENVDVLIGGRWVQTRVRKLKTSGYRLIITKPVEPKPQKLKKFKP